MVSDFGQASVGLWKNCTSGSCEDGLSYGGEGKEKDMVLSAAELCDRGSVVPAGDWVA